VARTEGTRASWRAHRSMASGHSGARKLVGGGTTERGEHGELGLGLTEARAAAWRSGGGGETAEERKLGNSDAQVSEEGESEMGEVR
jgi:hypothetical protein